MRCLLFSVATPRRPDAQPSPGILFIMTTSLPAAQTALSCTGTSAITRRSTRYSSLTNRMSGRSPFIRLVTSLRAGVTIIRRDFGVEGDLLDVCCKIDGTSVEIERGSWAHGMRMRVR